LTIEEPDHSSLIHDVEEVPYVCAPLGLMALAAFLLWRGTLNMVARL
jgi:hypothetical protein